MPRRPRALRAAVRQIGLEPSRRMGRDGFERARFGKEMRGARNDLDRLGPSEPRQRLLVQLDHAEVVAADDQKRRRLEPIES